MISIKFENISKQYRLGLVSTRTISHDLNRWWQTSVLKKEDPYLKIGEVNDRSKKAASEYVWALRDINFEVQQGDVLGIIGKNGAGKSTLLKILSQVTTPTTGSIKAKGRIASLLEVGTGFHPEMTGRENIYLNGAILGMTKAEINRKLDEIVDFSGVERYLDTPTKRYSSGMTVRLGFAIAAHLDPEILVVDEVLAVGDAEFQKKAIGKMQDVSKGEGRTVLFVSHNMNSIQKLCKNAVLLKDGFVQMTDTVENVINKYLEDKLQSSLYKANLGRSENEAIIEEIVLLNGKNEEVSEIQHGEFWKIKVKIRAFDNIGHFILGVSMFNQYDVLLKTNWTPSMDIDRGEYEFILSENLICFTPGQYSFDVAISSYERNIEYLKIPISLIINESSKKVDSQVLNLNCGVINNKFDIDYRKC